MPPFMHGAVDTWQLPVPLTVTVLGTAAVYLKGWRSLRAGSPAVTSGWHAGSFFVGLLLIWLAVATPLASRDGDSLTVHMIQHLLLMTFAAPLILLGEPVASLLRGLPAGLTRRGIELLANVQALRRFGCAVTHPLVCWIAATATLVVWHVPAVFALGLQSSAWHAAEHTSFLVTGQLFWWPVVEPWPSVPRPRWSIVLYLFLATLPCDILSGFLMFSDRIAYAVYVSSSGHNAGAVLSDQQSAAALMWTAVTIVYLVAGTIVATRLLAAQLAAADPAPWHQHSKSVEVV
jgi:putative membrane protein